MERNNFVRGAIDMYMTSTEVRTYVDLEQFVVATISKYLKRPIQSFIEVGLGYLHSAGPRSGNVQHVFGFDEHTRKDPPTSLRPISCGMVLAQVYKYFYEERPKRFRKDEMLEDPYLERDTNAFVREALRKELGLAHSSQVGVNVDARKLVHRFGTHFLFEVRQKVDKSLRTVQENLVKEHINTIVAKVNGFGFDGEETTQVATVARLVEGKVDLASIRSKLTEIITSDFPSVAVKISLRLLNITTDPASNLLVEISPSSFSTDIKSIIFSPLDASGILESGLCSPGFFVPRNAKSKNVKESQQVHALLVDSFFLLFAFLSLELVGRSSSNGSSIREGAAGEEVPVSTKSKPKKSKKKKQLQSSTDQDNDNDNDETDLSRISEITKHVFDSIRPFAADIPEFCRESIQSLFSHPDVANSFLAYSEEESSSSSSKGGFNMDFTSLYAAITSAFGEKKKARKQDTKDSWPRRETSQEMGLISSAVILHRYLQARQTPKLDAISTVLETIPSMAQAILVDVLSEWGNMGGKSTVPASAICTCLRNLEQKIVESLQIPAFACINKGNFLSFALQKHCPTLEKIFLAFSPASAAAAAGAGKSSSSSSVDSFHSPAAPKASIVVDAKSIGDIVFLIQQQNGGGETLMSILKSIEGDLKEMWALEIFEQSELSGLPPGLSFVGALQYLLSYDDFEWETEKRNDLRKAFATFCSQFQGLKAGGEIDQGWRGQQQKEGDYSEVSFSARQFLETDAHRVIAETLMLQLLFQAGLSQSEGKSYLAQALRYCSFSSSLSSEVSEAVASHLIESALASGILMIQSGGRVLVAQENSSLILLHVAKSAAADEVETSHDDDDDDQQTALNLISSVELGQSVYDSSIWSFFQPRMQVTLFEFIATHSEALRSLRSGVVYFALSTSSETDLIVLPSVMIPNKNFIELFDQAVASNNLAKIAAFCVSANKGLIDGKVFGDVLKQRLVSYKIHNCESRLLKFCLELVFSMPATLQRDVLLFTIQSASQSLKCGIDDVLTEILDLHQFEDSKQVVLRLVTISMMDGGSELQVVKRLGTKILQRRGNLEGIFKPVRPRTHQGQAASQSADSALAAPQEFHSTTSSLVAPAAGTDSQLLAATQFFTAVPPSPLETNIRVEQCKTCIREILCATFGYEHDPVTGFLVPPKAGPMTEMAHNMAEGLGPLIYSDRSHFLLEMLQNADDNKYAADVVPRFSLVSRDNCLYVYNNEVGFSEDNMRSLCNMMMSNKKGKAGYIGQKGIGWKSVFAVSDTPEVHSNGFHVRFDSRQKLGMMCPTWISNSSDWLVADDESENGTVMKIALRNGVKSLQFQSQMKKAFSERLLLFLRHIECTEFTDVNNGVKKTNRKQSLTSHWVRLETSEALSNDAGIYSDDEASTTTLKQQFWFVESKVITPSYKRSAKGESSLLLLDEERVTTTVSIAFPFKPIQEEDQTTCLRPDVSSKLLPIYAFLPTELHIFQFIVQGDFTLAAARDKLYQDDPWNKELLEVLPELLVSTISEMAKLVADGNAQDSSPLPLPSPMRQGLPYNVVITLKDILSLLPRPAACSNNELFEKVVVDVFDLLYDVPFLKSDRGVLCPPSDLVCFNSLALGFSPAALIPEDVLFSCTQKRYMNLAHRGGEHHFIDDELVSLLKLEVFGIHTVKLVLDSLLKSKSLTTRLLAGLLLTLERLYHAEGVPQAQQQQQLRVSVKSIMVPVQVTLRSKTKAVAGDNSASAGGDDAQMLRHQSLVNLVKGVLDYAIWPLEGGETVSLTSAKTIYIPPPSNDQPLRQRDKEQLPAAAHCLRFFQKQFLFILSNDLFVEADKFGKDFSTSLRAFLRSNFQLTQNNVRFGFEASNQSTILQKVVLPFFETACLQVSSGDPLEPAVDRLTCCALLAYAFLGISSQDSTQNTTINGHLLRKPFLVPVVRAKDNQRGSLCTWATVDKSKKPLFAVAKNLGEIRTLTEATDIRPELHLGLEFLDSAALKLSKMSTLLKQVQFTIVDPLVAALILNVSDDVLDKIFLASSLGGDNNVDEHVARLETHAVSSILSRGWSTAEGEKQLKRYKSFLKGIGCVNLFGLYSLPSMTDTEKMEVRAPWLFALIGSLLKNAITVTTRDDDESLTVVEPDSWIDPILPQRFVSSFFAADALQSGSTGHSPRLYVPVFLPSSPSMVSVSPIVHEAAMEIAKLISQELLDLSASSTHQRCADWGFLQALRRLAWFPVILNQSLRDHLGLLSSTEGGQQTMFLLTAPTNVFELSEWMFQRRQFPLGPHALYTSSSGSSTDRELGLAHPCWNEESISPQAQFQYYVQLIVWMSHQSRSLASRYMMRALYDSLLQKIHDGKQFGIVQQTDDLKALLSDEAPFLWCATGNLDDLQEKEISWGTMIPLQQVVFKDLEGTLSIKEIEQYAPGCPIKPLAVYYPVADIAKFATYFMRCDYKFTTPRVCRRCAAVQGMFGSRGLPLPLGGLRQYNYPANCCECNESGFGLLVQEVQPGLAKISPSLGDMVNILHHICKAVSKESKSTTTKSNSAAVLRVVIRDILQSISLNVWKSFAIKNSLHPYSAESLSDMRLAFQELELLPTMGHNEFVCADGFTLDEKREMMTDDEKSGGALQQIVIAVDNPSLWATFKADLLRIIADSDRDEEKAEDLPGLCLIDGLTSSGLEDFAGDDDMEQEADIAAGTADEFSIDALRADVENLLALSPDDFRTKVGMISELTFQAPRHSHSLFKFLGIKTLEDLVSIVWREPEGPPNIIVSAPDIAATSIIDRFNVVLEVTQRALRQLGIDGKGDDWKLWQVLGTRTHRMQQLLSLSVCVCDDLERSLTMRVPKLPKILGSTPGDEDYLATMSKTQIRNFHRRKDGVLYVNANCCETQAISSMCARLILSAVRTEVALLTQNQQVALMQDLEKMVEKFKSVDATDLRSEAFRYALCRLEDDVVPWRMRQSDSTVSSSSQSEPVGGADNAADDASLESDSSDSSVESESEPSEDVLARNAKAMAAFDAVASEVHAARPRGSTSTEKGHGGITPGVGFGVGSGTSVGTVASPHPHPHPPADGTDARVALLVSEVLSGGVQSSSNSETARGEFDAALASSAFPRAAGGVGSPRGRADGTGGTGGIDISGEWAGGIGLPPSDGAALLVPPQHIATVQPVSRDSPLFQSLTQSLSSDALLAMCSLRASGSADSANRALSALSASGNALSGLVGEWVAKNYFESRKSELGIATVRWINESQEQLLPFDLELTLHDGTVKVCEVKTHALGRIERQWYIQASELAMAFQQGERMCALCLNLDDISLDAATGQPVTAIREVLLVGWQGGLLGSIESRHSHLVLLVD